MRFISKKFSLTEIVKPNDPLTDEFGVAEYPNEKEKATILFIKKKINKIKIK